MYAYLCFYDKKLESEYKINKRLRRLGKQFGNMVKKRGLKKIDYFLSVYNLCHERGAHCDYRLIEETTVCSGKDEILLPLNDLPDEKSGEFNRKIFEILRGVMVSLEIFNSLLNYGNAKLAAKISEKISQVDSMMEENFVK